MGMFLLSTALAQVYPMVHAVSREVVAQHFEGDHLDGELRAQNLPLVRHLRAVEVTERPRLLKTVEASHAAAMAVAAAVDLTSPAMDQAAAPAGL
jgi:hypothetical protein